MTPEKMLKVLGQAGIDTEADFNDEEGGWFGWSFSLVPGLVKEDRGMLTIHFRAAGEDEAGRTVARRFWVMPA